MLTCPVCKGRFESGEQFCPKDGVSLRADDAPETSGDSIVGRMVGGRYRVERKLGQGGMGAVYRAVHVLMDKPVAIKLLRSEVAAEREAAARFHREARSASRLDHEYIIRVTDFGRSEDGLLYLVMELLEGQSLGREARRGPVLPSRAAALGVAIAEALQHAHENGVIHRDLKPDNVFLAKRGRQREIVKVLDFGLAKLVADGQPGTSITRDGTVFGTPEYMAPEQAEGDPLDGRTDIYALGVILYQLLVGQVPFSADNFVALLTKQVSEKPAPLAGRRDDGVAIPPGLEAVVLRCLEKKRDKRFGSAQELADALWPFVDEAALASLALPTRSGTRDGERRRSDDATPSAPVPLPAPTPPEELDDPSESETGTAPVSAVAPVATFDSIADAVVGRPQRRLWLYATMVLALVGGLGVWWRVRTAEPPIATPSASAVDAALETARNQLAVGAIPEAKKTLDPLPETAPVEQLRAALAEQSGERLNALAHLHAAAKLAPTDAEPRSQLASLLSRLGHTQEACREARRAIALDTSGKGASLARSVVSQHRCRSTTD